MIKPVRKLESKLSKDGGDVRIANLNDTGSVKIHHLSCHERADLPKNILEHVMVRVGSARSLPIGSENFCHGMKSVFITGGPEATPCNYENRSGQMNREVQLRCGIKRGFSNNCFAPGLSKKTSVLGMQKDKNTYWFACGSVLFLLQSVQAVGKPVTYLAAMKICVCLRNVKYLHNVM